MKKDNYMSPSVLAVSVRPHNGPLICVSGGSWNDSLQNVGSDWGGTDTDESDYGL